MEAGERSEPGGELALTLGGGGARGAYQLGLLRHLARRFPELEVPILTGVSAGGINAAFLANHTGTFVQKVEALLEWWRAITVDQVFRVDGASLLSHVVRGLAQLSWFGGRRGSQPIRGMVDTAPLRKLLERGLADGARGDLSGIESNLTQRDLRAVALTTTRYDTGQTVVWTQGRDIALWKRPQRLARAGDLRVEHVMASAALPWLFPAVRIGKNWYGDGGVRLHAPLAPAIHLGADRILAISTRYGRSDAEVDLTKTDLYPAPAQVAGILLNSIFLDLLDQDAHNLERVNSLLARVPEEQHGDLRPIDLLVLRPSLDLGKLANEYEPSLPPLFRFLTRRLGTKASRNQDLMSLIMFQPDYIEQLIATGERDAEERAEEISQFLS
ncbi:MAG: patatin-like phospholipase family protein [Planctomycetota bacterium]|jgi:NTE family protein|nr:patatin-like phospholipase family protein [Planctomycetota bacterium]MDP6761854.1 patatin-like phospholipase family protein [Planctomycetota bacterium]MDP6988900.1 patatin-like phospholipase family protein [Planctomycetota bacterium]